MDVIVLQRPDQPSLGADAAIVLKVVDEDVLSWQRFQSVVQDVVVPEAEVALTPVEVALSEAHLFGDLCPVASRFQCVDNMVRKVAPPRGKGITPHTGIR